MTSGTGKRNGMCRGGALLGVLWLSAVLSAIAFSVANTVRGEIERTSTASESLRAYYLAAGSIERALLNMVWGAGLRNPDGTPRYSPGVPFLAYRYASGDALVQIIPETAKLNINSVPPPELIRLLLNLGGDPQRASAIAAAVADWRNPAAAGLTVFDQFYLTQIPSFRARHASFEEIEELLLVKGMTPDLFYGSYLRDPQGRLIARGGLRDCLSVYGSAGPVDINSADPAVLATIGLSPDAIAAVVERRRARPFLNPQEVADFAQAAGPAAGRLRVGGNLMYTLRATARLRAPDGRLSDAQRTVSALFKFVDPGQFGVPYHILRWYEN